MNLARTYSKRVVTALALALAAALAALALTAAAPASAASCPTFRVLHNDRIGPASLPAGNYAVTVETGLSCQASTQLLARFLADYERGAAETVARRRRRHRQGLVYPRRPARLLDQAGGKSF